MTNVDDLAQADKAAVYYFHHYNPQLCYSALKYCENLLIINAISETLPIDEADCGTWSGDSKEARAKRNDYLVTKLGDRTLVEKLVVDSDSALAFKTKLERKNTANTQTIYPICTNSVESQLNQEIIEGGG
ncbi:hypothetical protein PTW35_17355 [Photobacterium sp. DA100]|uniref:hypothetical protein n=1 Tax=Photobacterium sp. DA100 TaxID=3027472 RepID=UPI00247A5C64|nr:hypothetical protein [Photobacterium sp. DA100]WEM42251.1 hypothetical protein PTW35_17355 [Photobacterium sp. DA100]